MHVQGTTSLILHLWLVFLFDCIYRDGVFKIKLVGTRERIVDADRLNEVFLLPQNCFWT